MSRADRAASWAEEIAADDSQGYDQANRWGPNWDCSALAIQAYENAGAGVKSAGATYTGNMRGVFLQQGFQDVTGQVNLATCAGMARGDVLLNERHHTAIYLGGGRLVHARGNELGGVTGGQSGDQTGREICTQSYFNYPWDCVLRLEDEEEASTSSGPSGHLPLEGKAEESAETYTVQSGDTLSAIAARHGTTVEEIARLNGIADVNRIWPGQVIKIRGATSSAADAAPPPPGEGLSEEGDITAMARDVIAGKYGNGLVRRIRLGKNYTAVQAEVNRLLAGK